MCGGCGVARQDWAGPILSSSHAKPLVARLLSGVATGLSVRATGVGWTVTQPGRPVTVHTSGLALLDQVSAWLVSRGVSASAVTSALETAPDHRAVHVTREMFPAARTESLEGGAQAVPSTQLVPTLLVAALGIRMDPGGVEQRLVLQDAEESWTLRVD
ncbi:hypothetical protein EV640_108125 [Nesterenkonia aurantiaca]|uniref:Uncharacterized protein n=1 Tax=Nesterenkonia aurantiaca TaxID=1436010 RepID=A0A4R7FZS5_9MICC|nr:hypothetical protein EV640_108125 [Nesterenkonia aurantiaca]